VCIADSNQGTDDDGVIHIEHTESLGNREGIIIIY
jgi:hypothetical protein